MSENDKPIVWLYGEVKTPPFSQEARIKAGFLLRKLQRGELLELPVSRPMPVIGRNCHELRLTDKDKIWRIIYYLESDAVVILEVFIKKTQKTPPEIVEKCRRRLSEYKK